MDFKGPRPSFYHFGALVMLVPLLELQLWSYNTIYLDIDIALVKDPIPLLNLGK